MEGLQTGKRGFTASSRIAVPHSPSHTGGKTTCPTPKTGANATLSHLLAHKPNTLLCTKSTSSPGEWSGTSLTWTQQLWTFSPKQLQTISTKHQELLQETCNVQQPWLTLALEMLTSQTELAFACKLCINLNIELVIKLTVTSAVATSLV